MATIINNPPATNENAGSGMGVGMIIGIILLVIVAFLLVAFGWPAMRSGTGSQNTGDTNGGTTYNVPDQIDVNVQKK